MARTGRVQSKIGVYHVLLRGMNELFVQEKDFLEFISALKKYSGLGSIRVFSYSLLKNRIHLVVGVSGSIGAALKPLCTSYARYFNRTYQREGKLFYDRLKSEPIDSEADLKNVVSFVNSISAGNLEFERYSSISEIGKEICVPGMLSRLELLDTSVTEMFIEDYDCLSKEEISRYIYALCGIMPKDFSALSANDQREALAKLTKKRWIAKNKLYDILAINRPRTVFAEQQTAPTKDQGLSVWLL